jgi:ABC-type transport system substrate-binding protein
MLRRPAAPVRLVPFILALALVAAACGGGADEPTQGSGPSTTGATPVGGTLKLALQSDVQEAFDPQKEYYGVAWAFDRCCLLRTLLSYNGKTTAEGGAEVQPDLASALPEQSADGLTWTFSLKPGIRYSPPLDDVSVTAQDFIRAMEREACGTCSTGGYSFYYTAIEGFDEFAAGDADTITGLEAPDDSTLIVRTTTPTGDLPFRMAMPAAAPIPPLPGDPKARLGIATGHDDNFGGASSAPRPTCSRAPTCSTSRSRPTTRSRSPATTSGVRSSWFATRPTTRPPTICARATWTASRSRSAGTRTTSR